MRRSIALDGPDWKVKGYLGLEGALAAGRQLAERGQGWFPASVPGSVVHDLWRAGEIPDPYADRNSLAIEWVSQRAWLYRHAFSVPDGALPDGARAWLRFEGLDFAAQLFLDGELLGRHEGMFTPFEIEVGERLQPGTAHDLAVVLEPSPETEPQTGRTTTTSHTLVQLLKDHPINEPLVQETLDDLYRRAATALHGGKEHVALRRVQ